jgi:hypothetical protein
MQLLKAPQELSRLPRIVTVMFQLSNDLPLSSQVVLAHGNVTFRFSQAYLE